MMVDVREFGPTGETVDATNTIAAALATVGDIYFPPGVYNVRQTDPLCSALSTFNKGRTLRGAGMFQTVIRLVEGRSLLAASNVSISGITFDGSFDPATQESSLVSMCQVNSDSLVTDCRFTRSSGSCLVGVGHNIEYRGNRFDRFGDHAIYILGEVGTEAPYDLPSSWLQTAGCKIHGNTITDHPEYHTANQPAPRGAIKLRNNVDGVTVLGNTVHGDHCVVIEGDTRRPEANPRSITISGNQFHYTHAGVHLENRHTPDTDPANIIDAVTVTGNDFHGSGGNAVSMRRALASVKGNTIRGGDTAITNEDKGDVGPWHFTGNDVAGVRVGVFKPGAGSFISGNTFTRCAATGVYALYPVDIIGNQFAGCSRGVDALSASYIGWNRFHGCGTDVRESTGAGATITP